MVQGSKSTLRCVRFGVIILGNTGVGKSFLCNILLGAEIFKHQYSPSSVTTETGSAMVQYERFQPVIFNIPGLIEADQQRIELNKKEIQKAFTQEKQSIIIYVFGNQNGRIRDEDVLAFNAINAAYDFNAESLLIIMNGLSKQRPDNYESMVIFQLKRVLGIGISHDNICFLEQIDQGNTSERKQLKETLLQVCAPQQFLPSYFNFYQLYSNPIA